MTDKQTSDDEFELEILHQFERAGLALERTKASLHEAREALDSTVPRSLYENLIPALMDIDGLTKSVLPQEAVAPAMPQPYRSGLLCSINGVGYWHTGRRYWIAIGASDGPQEDLRELPGFDTLRSRFDHYNSLLLGDEWREAGHGDPEVATALEVLLVRSERLWWDAVIEFLRAYKGQRIDRELARRALLECGFDAAKVARLLPD